MSKINELLKEIIKNPKKIEKYKLDNLSLDDWTNIFKTNENVKKYLPIDILRRKEIQAILVGHGHCRYFEEFQVDIPTSRNFILLCMQRIIFFSAKEINEIDKIFPKDQEILEAAFKCYNLKGVLRRRIKKTNIIKFAKDSIRPNQMMGDFDLYRLPRRFQTDEEFIKQLCHMVPSSYPTVLLLKQHYTKEFVLYILEKLKTSKLMGWELQQSWYQLTKEHQEDKEIAHKFFSVMLKHSQTNPLININEFVSKNKELLKDSVDFKNFKEKPSFFDKFLNKK